MKSCVKTAKHFWSFAAKQRWSIILNNQRRWGRVYNVQSNQNKQHKMASCNSSGVIHISGNQEIQQ